MFYFRGSFLSWFGTHYVGKAGLEKKVFFSILGIWEMPRNGKCFLVFQWSILWAQPQLNPLQLAQTQTKQDTYNPHTKAILTAFQIPTKLPHHSTLFDLKTKVIKNSYRGPAFVFWSLSDPKATVYLLL